MRVAVVADIHGNQRAFHAVLADLKDVAPDLIVHGGDLVFRGTRISSPIGDSGQNTELLSPESHSNPKLNIADIAAVSQIAQPARAVAEVENTGNVESSAIPLSQSSEWLRPSVKKWILLWIHIWLAL